MGKKINSLANVGLVRLDDTYMNVTAAMTASGLDTVKKVVGAGDNGIAFFLSFARSSIFPITHQSMEERPARVRATRREVADM
jgi:multisubunit Na+/H+ antiporter MnhG subunit